MNTALVKIICDGEIVGNGFLIDSGYIVTCAHVIRKALKTTEDEIPSIGSSNLVSEFYWHEDILTRSLKIIPEGYVYDGKGADIAILSLSGDLPDNISGLRLAKQSKQAFRGWTKAYIPQLGASRKIEGDVDDEDEFGRKIISASSSVKQFVEPGCSGAPIFLENGELVEAMISVRDKVVPQAFAIPATKITELLEKIVSPKDKKSKANANGFDQAIIDFLGNDPILGDDATEYLRDKDAIGLENVLRKQNRKAQQLFRIPKLAESLGDVALRVGERVILEGSWHEKVGGAYCFKGLKNLDCYGSFERLLSCSNFDVLQSAFSAAGYCGISERLNSAIENLTYFGELNPPRYRGSKNFDDYAFGKLAGSAIESLMWGFNENPRPHLIDLTLKISEDRGKNIAPTSEGLFSRAFHEITPPALKVLFDYSENSDSEMLTRLTLNAMQHAKLEKYCEFLIDFIIRSKHYELGVLAAYVLGTIGTERIARKLQENISKIDNETALLWALSMLLQHSVLSPPSKLINNALKVRSEVSAQLLVSLSLRDDFEYEKEAFKRFDSANDGLTRYSAGLALALGKFDGVENVLKNSYLEAESEIERLLLICAEIFTGNYKLGRLLHTTLVNSTQWKLRILRENWKNLIIAALTISNAPRKSALCWSQFLQTSGHVSQKNIRFLIMRISKH